MNLSLSIRFFGGCLVALSGLEASGADPLPSGRLLAAGIRNRAPVEDTTVRATLKITGKGRKRSEMEVIIRVILKEDRWLTIYQARKDGQPWETWHVTHANGARNVYSLGNASGDQAKATQDAYTVFAESDFRLADLGLEFLFWPKQTVLRRERRKSRLCHVLESRNPIPSDGHYHRVISWVDVETDGIVLADAFQEGTRPVKRFSVKGLSKIDGRWQVDELEMRNLKTGSRSRLRFHLEKPAQP